MKSVTSRPANGSGKILILAKLEKAAKPFALSPRQSDVLRLIVCGCTRKQIADELAISQSMVRVHIERIYLKANGRSIVEVLGKMIVN